ncbi:hypothetical protein ACN6QX_02475, partial [Acinetobacter baumannii]
MQSNRENQAEALLNHVNRYQACLLYTSDAA